MTPAESEPRGAEPDPVPGPLAIKDCALTALATGQKALTLRELRDRLRSLPVECLYYHFWGRLLRPVYERREFNNDFANWAAFQLRDPVLAERLALLDPAEFGDADGLMAALLERVEERVAEVEERGTAAADEAFHFLHAELVIFDTHRRVETPAELARLCGELSAGSVYYHFVDARQRSPDGVDDFHRWLGGFGSRYQELRQRLRRLDVHFSTLDDLRDDLTDILRPLADEEEAARV